MTLGRRSSNRSWVWYNTVMVSSFEGTEMVGREGELGRDFSSLSVRSLPLPLLRFMFLPF